MPRGLYIDRPQHVTLSVYEDGPFGLRIRFVIRVGLAAIKHGTLFHLFSGKSPFEHRRFDMEQRLFVPREDAHGFVEQFVGDMVEGTVEEMGADVSRFQVGDRVYCYGPVCETVTKSERNVRPLRTPLTSQDAVCQDPALFAYGAVRDAGITIGDNIVLFGLGAIGLMMVQLLLRAGCLNFVAVDPFEKRRSLAQRLGASLALDPTHCDVAHEVRHLWGQGADIAMEASGHYPALHTAMRSVRQCGRVLANGYYKGADSGLELGAEFFHNRLELIASLPAWDNPPAIQDGTWSVSPTQSKRCLHTVGLPPMASSDPVVPFDEAAQAFLDIYHDPTASVKLGVRFP